jgi:3-hydroxybutyryl-CoA dehydrogenase
MSSSVAKITVLGAGTMGHGLAQVSAASGFETTLYDLSDEFVRKALEKIGANLQQGIAKGKVTDEERDATLARLSTSTESAEALSRADLVIEAAPERMNVKLELVDQANRFAPDHAIFATNTSSLSVTEIAAAAKSPERVIGMHFFNPPYVLKLLEIVRAQQTSDETLATVRGVGERMAREMIVVNDSPGFATSRLGLAIGLEAMRMLQEGVGTAEDIDRAMELGYRHPMGPLKLTDLVGLDVRLAIAEYLHEELGGEQFRPPQILRKMVRAGKLGKKTGEGFHKW